MQNKLAIKTPDNRILFTKISNLLKVLDYARTINLELSIAKTKKSLELDKLVEALCASNINLASEPHEIVRTIYPALAKNTKRNNLEQLRAFITNKLVEDGSLNIATVKQHFPSATPSTISYCMSYVIKELSESGIDVQRVRRGIYELRI